MGKSNSYSNSVLGILFQASPIANIADNAASSPLTNLYVALHTADPGAAGNQSTSEIAYTSYARVAVVRTSGGWALASQTITPVAAITFPSGTGGSGTATYFSIGSASSGAGVIYYSGPITPNIVCGNGVTPQLTTATTVTES